MTESIPSSGLAMLTSSGGIDDKPDAITNGATVEVFEDEGGNACFQIRTRNKFREKTTLHQDLIDFLVELQQAVIKCLPGNHLPIFTRHRRVGQMFLAASPWSPTHRPRSLLPALEWGPVARPTRAGYAPDASGAKNRLCHGVYATSKFPPSQSVLV